jgi:hypothetical protein
MITDPEHTQGADQAMLRWVLQRVCAGASSARR